MGWSAILLAWAELEQATVDGEARIGRDGVNVIGPDAQIVGGFSHRQGGDAGEKSSESTFMLRIEVLHQHKAHAGIRRQMLQQLGKGFETARGGANADDGETV